MFERWSIRRKLTGGVLLTSGAVLFVTATAFLAYDLVTLRQSMVANLEILARVIAANSTAALAFDNREDATSVLAALSAEPHVVAAGLYDKSGVLFASYPEGARTDGLPGHPDLDGYQFTRRLLSLSEPVSVSGRRLGTVYVQSDLGEVYSRLALYGGLVAGVLALSFLVALALAGSLQRHISRPVLALVDTAARVADERDYSLRAPRFGSDELGRLTDAFNAMLEKVQRQDATLHALNAGLELRVQERTQALEAANKELEAFSYSVSHDLRAPLRAITGFSRILIDEHLPSLPEEAAGYLRRVAKGAQQMGQLVDDLLAFARLGRSEVRRVRVEPASIAQSVIDELTGELSGRDVQVAVGTLAPCDADPALLKQVYVNLITNALKFTRHRTDARVDIGCETTGGEVVYSVKDNGAGFDMKYADKLFGVFQRLHRAEEYEGTGVGLAIVHRVITRHGGRIWAQAAPGEGASFYFTIGARS